ncbi:DHH family phosphoesterase [Candidatus Magnetomonas plexicatena]|uniref:DHH family phosphoesterase n=1 Tax=Candidatus Magnetomonas plexicatena TaxID=2552947 RepID=UPI001C797998|nr:bifunctional oligoribonuclease/PAP phosphatase NrnA [Nitrospirales bacterium LBB_01]
MNPPENLIKEIQKNERFYIVPHVFPDGDAVGSALALREALESLGKEVSIKSRDPLPVQYSFMQGAERFSNDFTFPEAESHVLIIVDCNTLERTGVKDVKFKKILVIDHHLPGDSDYALDTTVSEADTVKDHFSDAHWIVSKSPATGLLIYHVLNALSATITKSIAENIFMAISYDTGTFRHSNTTADSLFVCAKLVDIGVNPSYIANKLYNNWSEAKFLLFKKMMSQLEIYKPDVSVAVVTDSMFKETGALGEETENFVNFPLMVDSVNLSVFFREFSPQKWKVSLRSQGGINVAAVAGHFGGGGHKNAAGYRVSGTLEEVKGMLLEKLKML